MVSLFGNSGTRNPLSSDCWAWLTNGALQMKEKAHASICADLEKGTKLLEGWQRSKMEQLVAQQKRDLDALLQRSCLQRDELERSLRRTLEQHDKRCGAVVVVSHVCTLPPRCIRTMHRCIDALATPHTAA
jgi:hypothetical protein